MNKQAYTKFIMPKSSMGEFTELIPGLPEEIALECLTRLHYSAHGVASRVCRRWRSLLQSRDFYYHRKQEGRTHKVACLIQSPPSHAEAREKEVGQPGYGVSLFDPMNGTWDRADPVPEYYPGGLPLFCQVTSSEGKLVLMGGWDPVSYKPLSRVLVYEFTTRRWRRVTDMPEKRSFFAVGELHGRVIVAGGHDENKNAMSSAWVYDVGRDEWTELPRMSQERDECEGLVIGSEFWVVSGYRTESQGGFEASAELIDMGASQWKRIEGAWKAAATQCPRSCIGVDKDGNLISWASFDSTVTVGACAVQLGGLTLVSGSACQGGPQGFFIVDRRDGKWKRLDVPGEFSGFVQSGCCVEI